MKITLEITPARIADLMVTAIESAGVTYWCMAVKPQPRSTTAKRAGDVGHLITPQQIVDLWLPKLRAPAGEMLRYLFQHRGRAVPVDELARAINRAPGNGYWYGGVKALRYAGLIDQHDSRGELRAARILGV